MDWKELLSSKVNSGELPCEDSTPDPATHRAEQDTLRVVTDRKGRKGKTATIVEGFTCSDEELAEIASGIKTRLGTGGSSRGGEILIQGDVQAKVTAILRGMGYKVK